MAYYKRNDGATGCGGLVLWFGIGYAIIKSYGWRRLPVLLALMIGLVVALLQYGTYKQKRDQEKRAQAPCNHGITGALYGFKPCVQCQRARAHQEQMVRRRAAEEEARNKAEDERAYKEWVKRIRLPEYLRMMHPEDFEHLICDLFRKMGYEVEETSYSRDGGVDGYLKKNGELSILQCKRVRGSVGEPILRDLFGTMHAHRAKRGMVVTTGQVSKQARKWSKNKPITILELDELVSLIRTHYREGDVVPEKFVPQERKSSTCPKCSKRLKVVTWKGKRFLGCSGYPSCRFTTSLRKGEYRAT